MTPAWTPLLWCKARIITLYIHLILHNSFRSKVPSTTQQIAVNYTASMLSSSSDDSGDERWGLKIWDKSTGEAMAREKECCKVLNCSFQEGTANPPSRNPYAAAWFTWLIHFVGHTLLTISTTSYPFLETHYSGKCVLAISIFKLDHWNRMHFGQHILLAILTTSRPFLESQSVLETPHSSKCVCLLRIW